MIEERRLLCGRYRLQQPIGRGGMADVYLAFDELRQAPVAVKILREDMAEDPVLVRRFSHEAEALSKLDHPNIVHFYAFEQDGHLAFIVMDYIEGTTLRWRLFERRGPLPLDEVTRIVRDLRSALHYAHLNRIVHRDLKPGNVMLQRDGRALLTDFGISHGLETTTMTGPITGTPAYMSPEQIEEGEVTAKSDVYSLGALMFEMVTGRRPFTGEEPGLTQTGTSLRIQEAHLHLAPPNPRDFNSTVPQAAADVILRALAKRPEDRWPDVLTLGRAWEHAVGGTAAAVPPVKNPEIEDLARAEQPVKPGRPKGFYVLPVVLALAVVAIAAVIVLASRAAQTGDNSAAPAVPPTKQVAAQQVTAAPTVKPPAAAPKATRKPAGGGVAVIVPAQDIPPTEPPTLPTAAPTETSIAIGGGGEPTVAPTFTPYVPPTAAPPATAVPTRPPAPTVARAAATAAPKATLAPAATGGVVLLAPPSNERITGTGTFAWEDGPGFVLGGNETYEFIIWGMNENPMVSGRSPVGASRQKVVTANLTALESALGLADGGVYNWGVRLFANGKPERMLSEARLFIYGRAGQGDGGGNTGGIIGGGEH